MAGLDINLYQGIRRLGNSAVSLLRGNSTGAQVVTDGHARFQEAVIQGNVFTMALSATTTGVAAGNIVGAAAGAALTGGTVAPVVHSVADFTTTATAQASTGVVKAIENLDGKIIIAPGMGWVPLWSAAGTALLNSYSVTYEKVAI